MKYVVLLILLLSSAALCSEHLEPEDSQFTGLFMPGYYGMVLTAFSEAYKTDVRARAIVFPSFSPEFSVFIKERNGTFSIVSLSPETSYWGYKLLDMKKNKVITKGLSRDRDEEGISELEKEYPKDYRDLKIDRCEVEINPSIADAIVDIWLKMLLQTRYKKEKLLGFDGADYHFSMSDGYQTLGGKIWSPSPESKTGILVELTHLMRAKCQTQSDELDVLNQNNWS